MNRGCAKQTREARVSTDDKAAPLLEQFETQVRGLGIGMGKDGEVQELVPLKGGRCLCIRMFVTTGNLHVIYSFMQVQRQLLPSLWQNLQLQATAASRFGKHTHPQNTQRRSAGAFATAAKRKTKPSKGACTCNKSQNGSSNNNSVPNNSVPNNTKQKSD